MTQLCAHFILLSANKVTTSWWNRSNMQSYVHTEIIYKIVAQACKWLIFFPVFIMFLSSLILEQIISGCFCLENALRYVIINQSKLMKMLPFRLKIVYSLLTLL